MIVKNVCQPVRHNSRRLLRLTFGFIHSFSELFSLALFCLSLDFNSNLNRRFFLVFCFGISLALHQETFVWFYYGDVFSRLMLNTYMYQKKISTYVLRKLFFAKIWWFLETCIWSRCMAISESNSASSVGVGRHQLSNQQQSAFLLNSRLSPIKK